MLPAPDLRKDTTLLYFLVEPSEETLEALPVIKHYFSHMIHPLSATKGTHILDHSSHSRAMCQGKGTPFRGRDTDGTLPRVSDELYLPPGIEISGIGSKKSIAQVMVKPGQMGNKLRHEFGNLLPEEGEASGR